MNEEQLQLDEYDHIVRQQPEMEFQLSLIDGLLAQIFVQNYHQTNNGQRIKLGLLLIEQIEEQVRNEAAYRAQEKIDENR